MGKPLDELREILGSTATYPVPDTPDWVTVEYALMAIDQFEAEHPGLVDQTLVCDTCHQPYKGPGWMRNHSTPQKVDIRIVCPACAKEAEHE